MSDQNFHEIQLSGKQLVFLFISAVGLAVVIFLLGVSVGRGVRGVTLAGATVDTGAPGDTVVATTPPPATQPAPGELSYHDTLQGRAARGAPPPTPPVEPPPAAAAPPATSPQSPPQTRSQTPPAAPPATDPAAGKTPPQNATAPQKPGTPATPPPGALGAAPPKEKPSEPAAKPAPKPPATGGWVVQVMALKSREGADKLASELKTKGYPAFVANPASSLYRVRVGPFPKRAEAEQIAARLAREGYPKPAVQAR
ncbi:MAG TPA: SPOR domain-containing protein [Vicinamibacterales bacterium]|nr:SPOR domain-containing protein [Vicinamibacterales bacterium]